MFAPIVWDTYTHTTKYSKSIKTLQCWNLTWHVWHAVQELDASLPLQVAHGFPILTYYLLLLQTLAHRYENDAHQKPNCMRYYSFLWCSLPKTLPGVFGCRWPTFVSLMLNVHCALFRVNVLTSWHTAKFLSEIQVFAFCAWGSSTEWCQLYISLSWEERWPPKMAWSTLTAKTSMTDILTDWHTNWLTHR